MKKAGFLISLLLCTLLLCACTVQGQSDCPPPEKPTRSPNDFAAAADTSDPYLSDVLLVDSPPWFATFRIVDGAQEGELLLAKNDAGAGEVYLLNINRMELDFIPQDGQLINVFFESISESRPAQFHGVSAVELTKTDADDRCGLYLQVLEDLWKKDSALNERIEFIGLDLSGLTHLSDSEKSALTLHLERLHNTEVITGTVDELTEQGYITKTSMGAHTEAFFYEWKNGILYSIVTDEDAVWNLPLLTEGEESPALTSFTAQKWRSSLGAYGFSDCVAKRAEDGSWTYTVGAEFIS